MGLGDGGHPMGPLPRGEGGKVNPVCQNLSRIPTFEAHDTLEERGLAHTVGPQDGQQLPGLGGEGDFMEHFVLLVAEGQVFDGQAHSFSSFLVMR